MKKQLLEASEKGDLDSLYELMYSEYSDYSVDNNAALKKAVIGNHLEFIKKLLSFEVVRKQESETGCQALKLALDNNLNGIAIIIRRELTAHKMEIPKALCNQVDSSNAHLLFQFSGGGWTSDEDESVGFEDALLGENTFEDSAFSSLDLNELPQEARLLKAASLGDEESLGKLLAEGFNNLDHDDNRALYIAINSDHYNFASMLLQDLAVTCQEEYLDFNTVRRLCRDDNKRAAEFVLTKLEASGVQVPLEIKELVLATPRRVSFSFN